MSNSSAGQKSPFLPRFDHAVQDKCPRETLHMLATERAGRLADHRNFQLCSWVAQESWPFRRDDAVLLKVEETNLRYKIRVEGEDHLGFNADLLPQSQRGVFSAFSPNPMSNSACTLKTSAAAGDLVPKRKRDILTQVSRLDCCSAYLVKVSDEFVHVTLFS